MNEEIKKALETLQELSGLTLKYLINNFHFINEEYVERKSQIANLTEKIKIALNNFYGYKDSQQDLIKGKDEYIAKLCNDRAELKEQNKTLKEELNEVNGFRTHYKNYLDKIKNLTMANERLNYFSKNTDDEINTLHFRNNLLVERLEKQKAELTLLRKFVKEIRQYYFIGLNGFEFIVSRDREGFSFVAEMVEKYGN